MLFREYGPSAWLIELDDPVGWAEGVGRAALDDVIEVVPAETTVLVRCRPGRRSEVGEALRMVEPVADLTTRAEIVIPVVYDGDDLDRVAHGLGVDAATIVEWHSGSRFVVAFCGFSPGFAYLRGLDERLHLPRRAVPRTSVPAGSVAIAAHYSAVYPSASPGGWHLIGTTDAVVWGVTAEPPARLSPGTPVRFERRP